MIKKLFKVTTATEDKDGFSNNVDNAVVLATTAEEVWSRYSDDVSAGWLFLPEEDDVLWKIIS